MNRLTFKNDNGTWGLTNGYDITKVPSELYGALWKLKEYENTGLTPDEILDGKLLTGWIPVEERLPKEHTRVIATFDDDFVATVEYADDWELWADSGEVVAWMPLPEPYKEDQNDR